MPKRHQQRPAKQAAGRNNPEKSTEITTGTYKKKETYHQQSIEHKNPSTVAQEAKAPPKQDPSMGITLKADSRSMAAQPETRSGSDSNAHKHRKDRQVHEHHQDQNQPQRHSYDQGDLFDETLHGPRTEIIDYQHTANDIKSLHSTLADLSDDELKSIVIVSLGSRLEQGAKYLDLRHLEQGDFVATANMIAGPDNLYVPKGEVDYLIWNRLMQVDNPKRLDESETTNE